MLTKRFVTLLVMVVVSAVGMLSCTQENAENKPPPGSIPDEEIAMVDRSVQLVPVTKRYVRWCLTEGQAVNESLGYLRFPPQVVTLALAAVDNL